MKCEHENPTGSHKDRAYRSMLKMAAYDQTFTLVDFTTGNGGISLAWLARCIGTEAVVFMPGGMTPARARLIRAHRAKLVLTARHAFVAGARAAAEQYVQQHSGAVLLNQSDNLANQHAFIEVGEELVVQLYQQSIKPTAFACAIGTGGTFSGLAAVLKGEFGALQAVGIEVPEAPVIWAKRTGETVTPSLPSIVGMGAGKIASNTDERLIDEIALVGAPEVVSVLRALQSEGLFVGPSTAANVLVASRLAEGGRRPVVTVSFDRADRYDESS
jgi:cysteine synthase A